MSNLEFGTEKTIDVINDGVSNNQLHLTNKGPYTGQFWKLTHINEDYYRLTCFWQGDNKSIDILNNGINTHVWLAATGNYSGQYWKLEIIGFI